MPTMVTKKPYAVLLTALFISGASGLINQIAWQRAVKVYLANSETLSSMIVVLVFMLGLGLGSLAAARRSGTLPNPFLALGLIEVLLCAVNVALIFVFGEELRAYGYALEAAAGTAGISPSLLCALLSFAVLSVPCFLMGLTIPVAAEAAQRQLEVRRKTSVSHFFFLNTVGAVLGTLGCGLVLMPLFGQKVALAFAAGGNLLAGLLILALLSRLPAVDPDAAAPGRSLVPAGRRTLHNEEVLAFALGALSLGYEIFLFRIMALAYTPLPWIFSVVLCGFLLFWSLGMAFSGWMQERTSAVLAATAASIAVVPFVLAYQRFHATNFPIWGAGLLYFLPCFGFGTLYGITVGRYAKRWGRDVGLFNALNTVGSGVGILFTNFVLFEMDKDLCAWSLAATLLIFVPYCYAKERPGFRGAKAFNAAPVLASVLVLWVGLSRADPIRGAQYLEFNGRDGVVEVARDGRVFIDGLWHSVLYRDDDRAAKNKENVRRKMLIALLPFLAHAGTEPKAVLNIGMGTGATARTLAKSTSVESLDAYEIVSTVRDVVARFPEETLGTRDLQKIHVYWEDARAGLVRREKKYDIITQSPMYLKQAGSSFLLSRQYFELVKSRLKDGGIAGIYCNSQGNEEQELLVRKTVSEVFPYAESFGGGYFILASNRPIQITKKNFQAKLVGDDPVVEDIKILDVDRILSRFDRPRLDWGSSSYIITDDHPLVEHPAITRLVFAHKN